MSRAVQGEIAAQQQKVREAYARHGCPSEQYEREFDKLHAMRMQRMAEQYRESYGLPPNSRTPYD